MLEYLLLILGFGFLVKGAQLLIDGASALAKKFGISSLIIGLTIVAFGTSAPELVIGLISSINGESQIVLGNVLGANITDVLLVLGISIYFANVRFRKEFVKKQFPFLVYSAILLMLLANDALFGYQSSYLSYLDGFLLLVLFGLFAIKIKNSFKNIKFKDSFDIKDKGMVKSIAFVIFGPVLLYLGGRLVVNSAIEISNSLGIAAFAVSSTLVAFGTTLPELTTAVVGIARKQKSIVVGEIAGSLIFNVLFILGLAALIHPIHIDPSFNVNMLFFSIVNLFLVWIVINSRGQNIPKYWGLIFIVTYWIYLIYNFFLF